MGWLKSRRSNFNWWRRNYKTYATYILRDLKASGWQKWGNVTLSRRKNDGGMKVMSRSDSPELRLTKESISHWAGAIDGSSLRNKDALKECIQRHQQLRHTRRAEPVKQEQLRITFVKNNSLIILEFVESITDISFASRAQTPNIHILTQMPVCARGKALKSEGQDIHRMNYWCEQSDHWLDSQVHTHR